MPIFTQREQKAFERNRKDLHKKSHIGRRICWTVWESNPANCDAAHALFGAIELINKNIVRLFIRW